MKQYGHLSDGEVQEELKRIRRQREKQRDADWSKLMAEPWGRRIVYSLVFEIGQLEARSFDAGVKYHLSEHMAHHEGRREFARDILDVAQRTGVENYLVMLRDEISARDDWMRTQAAVKAKAGEKEQ